MMRPETGQIGLFSRQALIDLADEIRNDPEREKTAKRRYIRDKLLQEIQRRLDEGDHE